MTKKSQLIEITVFFALCFFAIIMPFSVLCAESGPANKIPKNNGKIAIYNFHENEFREISFRDGLKYNPEGLKEVSEIMRSHGDEKTHQIDLRLIELLASIQEHFGAETVEIISGYRSPSYNSSLIDSGRGAARESMHKLGLAADIHIDEVDEQALFDYVKKLGIGGVGIYTRYNFVHVDLGPSRAWEEAPANKRILVGTENNPNPAWSALTDKNTYKPGDEINVAVTNNDYGSQSFSSNVWIEKFRKGRWAEHSQITKAGSAKKLKQGENALWSWQIPADQALGKYRLVIFANKNLSIPPVYSNEFYLRN